MFLSIQASGLFGSLYIKCTTLLQFLSFLRIRKLKKPVSTYLEVLMNPKDGPYA